MSAAYLIGHFEKFLNSYQPQVPLRLALKTFYRENKHLGSGDRKTLSDLVYSYFRVCFALPALSKPEVAILGMYLSGSERFDKVAAGSPLKTAEHPDLIPVTDRIERIKEFFPDFDISQCFPFHSLISNELNVKDFIISGLDRGKVFIRIRREYIAKVKTDFDQSAILYEDFEDYDNIFVIANPSQLRSTGSFNAGLFEIQDPGAWILMKKLMVREGDVWWDACCGSGGKSLALCELAGSAKIKLFASDIRPASAVNYHKRMTRASNSNFEFKQMDLRKEKPEEKRFDGIILDIPCSGSGTWHNAPENNLRFSTAAFEKFRHSQMEIFRNLIPSLKQGGQVIYITCSVFAGENEVLCGEILSMDSLRSMESGYIKGYLFGGDTYYYHLFTKL